MVAKEKAPKSQEKLIRRAKNLLAGRRGVLRNDSDDELGDEDHPWQYTYSTDGANITGARMGKFECSLGDSVLLKAEGTNEAWVGLICQFGDLNGDGREEDSSQNEAEKAAYFMWFSTEQEIRNKNRKRSDHLPHELYITPSYDWNPLTTINGKATILSHVQFQQRYGDTKISSKSADFGKTFLCRRGCNTRTATYTEEFDWANTYKGVEDIDFLVDLVTKGTISSRRRLREQREDADFVTDAEKKFDSVSRNTTPVKRRRIDVSLTPSKAQKQVHGQIVTPKHKKYVIKKPLEYSPLATRVISSDQISSPYQKARSQLHVSSVPTALPCREEAFATVYSHLEAAIIEGTGSCIYISGTPGTGKTATVREVIHRLDVAVQNEELDDFIFVEINGMKMTEPQQAYVQLWQALRGENVSPAHALELLEREFNNPNPRRIPCVVLMDELDQLVTKNQSVMYNFFNWPSLRHSRLIVLAVANTMDLPERTLSNKISSRLGLVRIPFAGYAHTDLMKIIQSRLEGIPGDIVESDAIQFASRKVAAVSGDARRALEICRRAVEIAESDVESDGHLQAASRNEEEQSKMEKPSKRQHGKVTIATIKRAITEATTSPIQQALRGLSVSAKVLLAALVARSKRTGLAEAALVDLVDQSRRMANASDEAWVRRLILPSSARSDAAIPNNPKVLSCLPRVTGLSSAAEELIELGIITMEARRGDRVGKVRLCVNEEEVRQTLKDDHQARKLGF